jgi:hypothetical protein
MTYLVARLKEKSTYSGILALLSALGGSFRTPSNERHRRRPHGLGRCV